MGRERQRQRDRNRDRHIEKEGVRMWGERQTDRQKEKSRKK